MMSYIDAGDVRRNSAIRAIESAIQDCLRAGMDAEDFIKTARIAWADVMAEQAKYDDHSFTKK